MRHLGKFALGLWLALAAPLAAQNNLVVVELYTSQGCSSCPPSDQLMGELAQRDDVLGLALHVDYWDYIGWKDQFADPAYTARQKAYARANEKRSVYTPQMIVGGRDFIVGFKPMDLADHIQAHRAAVPGVDVALTRRGDRVEIEVSDARRKVPMVIDIVAYIDKHTVAIARGENAGRTLDYHNIVSTWARVGEWNGNGVFQATVQISDARPVAVIVQERDYGPILGAARLK